MLKVRVIPVLLLRNGSLIKTVRFGSYTYVGDPCNTVRIFNELEVDELMVLDVTASLHRREPDLALLEVIASECFMPLGYGGGISTMMQAKAIFKIGFEKVIVNSYANIKPEFISELADHFGNQAVIASIDVRRDFWGRSRVYTHSGKNKTAQDPVQWAQRLESLGAGEILLTSIDQEGTWQGFDIDLVRSVTDAVSVPVVAHGGAGGVDHIVEVVKQGNASAVALGSYVVFQKQGMGVLINFPEHKLLNDALS